MDDVFQPRTEPARSIYNAFQREAGKRIGRSAEESLGAELEAVFRESANQAHQLGLRSPSMDEVASAERYARGSVVYGARWAYRVVELMYKAEPNQA